MVIKHRRCGAARPRPKAHGTEALLRDAAVLIAWQHQDIPGISQSMLTQTRPPLGTFNIPKTSPTTGVVPRVTTSSSYSTGQLATGRLRNLASGQMLLAVDAPAP
jgi:hypothetical protein